VAGNIGNLAIQVTLDTSRVASQKTAILREMSDIEAATKRQASAVPTGKYAFPFVDPDTMRPMFSGGGGAGPSGMGSQVFLGGDRRRGRGRFQTQNNQMSNGGVNLAAQNLAFGFDDFVQQTQAQGLSAGLRAVGNNATAVASAFGPWATVLTAAGVALLSIGVKSMEAADSAEKLEKAIKSLSTSLESVQKASELEIRLGKLDGPDDAKTRLDELRDRLSVNQKVSERAQSQFGEATKADLDAKASQAKGVSFFADMIGAATAMAGRGMGLTESENFARDMFASGSELNQKESEELGKTINGLTQERLRIESEIARIQEKQPGLIDARNKKEMEEARGKEIKENANRMEQEFKRQESQAESLRRTLETETERKDRELKEIGVLKDAGAITPAEATEFRKRIQDRDKKEAIGPVLAAFSESNSAAALSTINRSARVGQDDIKAVADHTKATAQNTQQAANLLSQIADGLTLTQVAV
jgi:hypothetical protein